MTREYNHVRISFLPRRAVKSLEIERPIVLQWDVNVKWKEREERVESKTVSSLEVGG